MREILANPRLRTLLTRLDALGEREREQALELLIGATEPGPRDRAFDEEDVRVFQEFAKAVEDSNSAVDKKARRERLGLDYH